MNKLKITTISANACTCCSWNKDEVLSEIRTLVDKDNTFVNDDEWIDYVLDTNYDIDLPAHLRKTILDARVSEIKFNIAEKLIIIVKE